MPLHRATLFALAFLFTAGMTSAASACCGWGFQAPVAYAAGGCGGCGAPSAAAVYAQPVAPSAWGASWGTGWGGGWGAGCACQRSFVYAATPAVELTPIAPAPVYVVNQGPDYTGPGIMVPFHTWSAAAPVAPGAYPYLPGYGYGYGHPYWHGGYALHRPFIAPRFHAAYHQRFYGRPLYRAPMWRPAVRRYYR
jgi:hypothetical protein